MTDMHLRFPIGEFSKPNRLSADERRAAIARIDGLPISLADAVTHLGAEGLDTPYRTGGWTGRQVVHHIADSHVNAWVRFKLALTEDRPTIRPYNEVAWAELPDHARPVDESLLLISALHSRWVVLLKAIEENQWARVVVHPEAGDMTMDDLLANYAWHGDHHVAHIRLIQSV